MSKAIKELRKKSVDQLEKHAEELRKSVASYMIDAITTDEKNYKKARNMRLELARTLTLLQQPPVKQASEKGKDAKDSKEKK